MVWVEAVDPDSNSIYWYNTVSGEATWEKPADVEAIEDIVSVATNVWVEAVDPDSNLMYWYNTVSGEATWEKPADYEPQQQQEQSQVQETICESSTDVPEEGINWLQETDEDTGRSFLVSPLTNLRGWEVIFDSTSELNYYWDEATGSTTWDRPVFQYDASAVSEIDTTNTNMNINTNIKSHDNKADDFLSQVLSPSTLDKLQTISQSNTSSFISTSLLALLSLNPLSTSPKRSISSTRNNSLDENEELFFSNSENKANEKSYVDSIDIFGLSTHDTINWNNISIASIVSKMNNQSLKKYAEKYFDIDKSLNPSQLSELIQNKLTWKSEQLKEPLCVLSKELSTEAIACSKHIAAFVGERKTDKNQMQHASILLKHMLKAPKELRDEIYCQICKKIEGNPSFECTWSAWQLLVFCLATFPPSNDLYQPLLGFISSNIDGGGYHEFRKLAEFSLRSCILSSRCPARKEIPSLNELNILRGAESKITVQINYLDDEVVDININCWTLAKEFNDILVNAIALKPENAAAFALYIESSTGTSKVIEPEERICDVIATNESDGSLEASYKIVYKVRYFFDDDSNLYADDPIAFNLYYAQAVHDVYSGKYPCSKVDYLVLSALRAQEKYGDNLPILDKEGVSTNSTKDNSTDNFFWQLIVPQALFENESDRPNTLKQFFRIHKRLKGYSTDDAKSAFMDHVRSFKVYGSHFYFATYNSTGDNYSDYNNGSTSPIKRNNDNNTSNLHQNEDVVIAISNNALTVLQIETTFILLQFKYDQNLTWVYSNKSIIIMVSSDDGKSRKRYYLKTNQGKEINSFLNIYTNRCK